jgi:hypothetical protein
MTREQHVASSWRKASISPTEAPSHVVRPVAVSILVHFAQSVLCADTAMCCVVFRA